MCTWALLDCCDFFNSLILGWWSSDGISSSLESVSVAGLVSCARMDLVPDSVLAELSFLSPGIMVTCMTRAEVG